MTPSSAGEQPPRRDAVGSAADLPPGTTPAWLRPTPGEARVSAAAAILVAIVLQLVLPDGLAVRPRFLLPGLEVALLVGLVATNPGRMNRDSAVLRAASLILVCVIAVATVTSVVLLVSTLVSGAAGSNRPTELLGSAAAIWITNVLVFALGYWELDRGGPVSRALARRTYGDFLFPQMASPGLADPDWEPTFVDYLYLSFTNSTAFSPTDTLPLARWAKLLMALQSGSSLVTLALVAARAVNILGGS